MREKDLYRAIDKMLPKNVHRQSMTGAAMTANGTPDRYYDGPAGDLWIEYKQLKHMPRNGIVVGDYTTLQLHWMERRWKNQPGKVFVTGKGLEKRCCNIAGIVGLPNRTAVIQRTPTEWREGSPIANAIPLQEVAEWIRQFTGGWHEQPAAGVGRTSGDRQLPAQRRNGVRRVQKKPTVE